VTPLLSTPNSEWRAKALCLGLDQELFFPDSRQGQTYARARRVCGHCPVRQACLADALVEERYLSMEHISGMRGGLTPDERVARQPADRWCGSQRGYRQHLERQEPICADCEKANEKFARQRRMGQRRSDQRRRWKAVRA